jgi:LmbE family N-acetylglucosaminyl deacetylase
VNDEPDRLQRAQRRQRIVGSTTFLVVFSVILVGFVRPYYGDWTEQGRPMGAGTFPLLVMSVIIGLVAASACAWTARFVVEMVLDRRDVTPVRAEHHLIAAEQAARDSSRVADSANGRPEPGSLSLWDRVHLRHRRVLVVVAHPDDETFGLGAVVALLTDSGVTVDQLCFTRGEASTLGAGDDLAERRTGELRLACSSLGIGRLNVLPYPDGRLADVSIEELGRYIEAALEGSTLLLVFEPGGITGHPDHRAATAAALRVAEMRGLATLEWGLSPSVAGALRTEFDAPFTAVDGAGSVDLAVDRRQQRAAIACHASQSADNPVLRRRLELQGNTERVRYSPGSQF